MRNKADSPVWKTRKVTIDDDRNLEPQSSPISVRRASATAGVLRDWGGYLCLCLLICMGMSYHYLRTTPLKESNEQLLRQHHGVFYVPKGDSQNAFQDQENDRRAPLGLPVQKAASHTNYDDVGFVFLGLGPYARQLKCEAAIESLRSHGGWDGWVFLLTDAPKCYTQNDIWTDCGLDAVVVDVQDDLSSGFTLPSLYKTAGNRLRSKKYKTRIFELIPEPTVNVLIYVDCDMVVAGVKDGLTEFVEEYRDGFNSDQRIFLFPENNPGQLSGVVHTGIFIAHREWSAPVLQRWAEQLNTDRDASDQAAFVRAGITEYAFVDELKYLYRPRCDRDDCLTRAPLLFNHINGARCFKQGKEQIQSFVDRWGLCTYEIHNYCSPWYMSPYVMSWVPYTSCTKMEEQRS